MCNVGGGGVVRSNKAWIKVYDYWRNRGAGHRAEGFKSRVRVR